MRHHNWPIIIICVLALFVTATPAKTSDDVKLFDGSGPVQQDPGGSSALKIISPINLQTVNVNADGIFYIGAKTNPGFEFPNIVRLHFERKEEIPKGTEVAIPDKGVTHWWETVIVDDWGWPIKNAPIPVSESTPGFYRVRIRGLTHGGHNDIGGWTPWRYFCIGSNENCPTTLKTAKGVEKQVTQLEKGGGFVPKSDKKTMQTIQGESSLGPEGLKPQKIQGNKTMAKGGGFVPQRKDMKVQIESPLVASGSITGTLDLGKRKMAPSSITAQKTKTTSRVAAVQAPKPNIVVDNVSFMPPPKSGQKTHIYVYFKNTGPVKSSEGTEFTVKCKSAPKCFLADKNDVFKKEIPPGGKYLWIFETETLTAGSYKMEVITPSNSLRNRNSRLIELNVPGLDLKKPDSVNLKDKSKKKATVENVQPVPTDPGTRKNLNKTPSRTLGY